MNPIVVEDNSVCKEKLSEQQLNDLSKYAGLSLLELCKKEPHLLIFPHALGANDDDIGKQNLFDISGGTVKTGNTMGFFCVGETQVKIHSRFDESEHQYFLHYMLQRVMGINILNLKNHLGQDEVWEFLVYLFPYCLLRAVKQGIFRAYRQYECNDAKVKGAIDIARHLKLNLPFTGKIACRVREYSADNAVMQLIRHTVEFIRSDRKCAEILRTGDEIKEAVATIVGATPTYNARERDKVIFKNSRGANHPYFTEYNFLRDLCLRILRHDKVSSGQDENHIRGIVFDGSWLWEEYLATLLKKRGFEHPENKTGKGRKYLYKNDKSTGKIYPDFIGENSVLDAKYKRLDEKNISRDDRFQMISYMYVLNKSQGYLLYPTQSETATEERKELAGVGGILGTVFFSIPAVAAWDEFFSAMQKSEDRFIQKIHSRINNT